jgi:hypothetical protein
VDNRIDANSATASKLGGVHAHRININAWLHHLQSPTQSRQELCNGCKCSPTLGLKKSCVDRVQTEQGSGCHIGLSVVQIFYKKNTKNVQNECYFIHRNYQNHHQNRHHEGPHWRLSKNHRSLQQNQSLLFTESHQGLLRDQPKKTNVGLLAMPSCLCFVAASWLTRTRSWILWLSQQFDVRAKFAAPSLLCPLT